MTGMRWFPLVLLGVMSCAVPAPAAEFHYWVEPCSPFTSSCKTSDAELAGWALEAWAKVSDGKLSFVRTKDIDEAEIRLYWANERNGLYGEMRPFEDGNMHGAELFISTDLSGMGPEIAVAAAKDPILRDAIVYLTCLHESGHALGLPHTADFPDIMYSFQYGGDIPEYFGRYRRQLESRGDIQMHGGMSVQDQERLRKVFE